MTDTVKLDPEVVKALEISAVSGIRALQNSSGLGLYEAKLVIDAYLLQHPEHPLSQQIAEAAKANRQIRVGVGFQNEVIYADPIAGEPIPFESLQKEITAPECYVVLRELSDCENWLGEAIKACSAAMVDVNAVQIVDNEYRNDNGDISSAVLKLPCPLAREANKALSESLQRNLPRNISFHVVQAANWEKAATIPLHELAVEYFLKEFSRRGRMYLPTTSCVRLMHKPTGIFCRISAHRSRAKNYEEALLLLTSHLMEAGRATR
ncbi:peptide chain release factor family protein [Methylosoma difficile]